MMGYFKNLKNSAGFFIKDTANSYMPNTYRAVSAVSDAFKNMRARDSKTSGIIGSTTSKIKNQKHLVDLGKMSSNLINGIKSGNLYTKPDDGFGDMFGGEGMDLDSMFAAFDDLDDMDDGDFALPSMVEELSDPIVEGAKLTASATIDSASMIVQAQTETASTIHANEQANAGLRHVEVMDIMQKQNDNLATIVSFNNEVMKNYVDKATQYFDESISMLKDMHAGSMMTDVDKKHGESRGLEKAFGEGGLAGWAKEVKSKLGQGLNSQTNGISGMLGGAGWDMMMGSYRNNPLKMMYDFVVDPKLNAKFDLSSKIKKVESGLSDFHKKSQTGFAHMALSDNKILSNIGKALREKDTDTARLVSEGVEDKAIPFTGVTKRAIEVVIPTYLRKIEAGINKHEESVYDYTSGKFKKVSKVNSEFKSSMPKLDMETGTFSESLLSNMSGSSDYELDPAKFKKLVQRIATVLASNGYNLDHILSMSHKRLNLVGLDFLSPEEFYMIRKNLADMKNSPDAQTRLLFFETVNRMDDVNRMKRDYIESMDRKKGLNGMGALLDGSFEMSTGTTYKELHGDEIQKNFDTYVNKDAKHEAESPFSFKMSDGDIKRFNEAQASVNMKDYIDMTIKSYAREFIPTGDGEKAKKAQDWVGSGKYGKKELTEMDKDINSVFGKGKFFSQSDGSYAKLKLGDNSSVGESGCGLLSAAMVVSNILKTDINPNDLYDLATKYFIDGDGISFGLFLDAGIRYGIKVEVIEKEKLSVEAIKKHMADGNQIVSMERAPGGSHYIVLKESRGNSIIVQDPWEKRGDTKRNIRDIRGKMTHAIVFFKPVEPSGTATALITNAEGMSTGISYDDKTKPTDAKVEYDADGKVIKKDSGVVEGEIVQEKSSGISIGGGFANKKMVSMMALVNYNAEYIRNILIKKFGDLESSEKPKLIEISTAKGGKGGSNILSKIKGSISKLNPLAAIKKKKDAMAEKLKSLKNKPKDLFDKFKESRIGKAISGIFDPKKWKARLKATAVWREKFSKGLKSMTTGAKRLFDAGKTWGKKKAVDAKEWYELRGKQMLKDAKDGAKSIFNSAKKLSKSVFDKAVKGGKAAIDFAKEKGGQAWARLKGIDYKGKLKAGKEKVSLFGKKITDKIPSVKISNDKAIKVKVIGGKLDSVQAVGKVLGVGGISPKLIEYIGDKDPSKFKLSGTNIMDQIFKKKKEKEDKSTANVKGEKTKDGKFGGVVDAIKAGFIGLLPVLAGAVAMFGGKSIRDTAENVGLISDEQSESQDKWGVMQGINAGAFVAKKLGKIGAKRAPGFAKKLAKMAFDKVDNLAARALKGMGKKITSTLMKMLTSKTMGKIIGAEAMQKLTTKLIPKLSKKMAESAAKKGGRSILGMIPGIGAAVNIAFFAVDFTSGFFKAYKLWGIPKAKKSELSFGMRLGAGLVKGLHGLMTSIPFFGIALALVPTEFILNMTMEIFGSEEDKKKVSAMRDLSDVELDDDELSENELFDGDSDGAAMAHVKSREGFRSQAYTDTTGNLTIGYGTNLTRKDLNPADVARWKRDGITKEEAAQIAKQDLANTEKAILKHKLLGPIYAKQNAARKAAMLDMGYNMGVGNLAGFKKANAAMAQGDYATAAAEFGNSQYARQVGSRAKKNMNAIALGKGGTGEVITQTDPQYQNIDVSVGDGARFADVGCGIATLAMILRSYKLNANMQVLGSLSKNYRDKGNGVSYNFFVDVCRNYGLATAVLTRDKLTAKKLEKLMSLGHAIAMVDNDNGGRHYVAVHSIKGTQVVLKDPLKKIPNGVSIDDFMAKLVTLILVTPPKNAVTAVEKTAYGTGFSGGFSFSTDDLINKGLKRIVNTDKLNDVVGINSELDNLLGLKQSATNAVNGFVNAPLEVLNSATNKAKSTANQAVSTPLNAIEQVIIDTTNSGKALASLPADKLREVKALADQVTALPIGKASSKIGTAQEAVNLMNSVTGGRGGSSDNTEVIKELQNLQQILIQGFKSLSSVIEHQTGTLANQGGTDESSSFLGDVSSMANASF
jgi:GH24 family phage-related lysozyme (muramidase)/predicted double-glycine peptidase